MEILKEEFLKRLQGQDVDDFYKLGVIRNLLGNLTIQVRPRSKSFSHSFISSNQSTYSSSRSYICSASLLDTLEKKKVCINYSDSREQYQIIYENFILLYRKNLSVGSRLNNEKPEIFFTVIKQFFLDKFLLTEDYFAVINNILKRDLWVDIFTFAECIEQVQTNFFSGFYYFFVSPPVVLKASIDKQKIICKLQTVFYRFVDSREKGLLSQLDLIETMKFSFPRMKEAVISKKVYDMIANCNLQRKQVRPSITIPIQTMSKMKKLTMKKTEPQPMHSNPSLSHLRTLHHQNLSQSTDKLDPYSESPYSKKISKIRSQSTLKDPRLTSNPLASPFNPKLSLTLKQTLNSSFVPKLQPNESQVRIKKKPISQISKSIESQSYLVELKLEEISTFQNERGLSFEVFEKFQEIFEEVIAKDKVFGQVLKKIKNFYEDCFKRLSPAQNLKLKNDLAENKKRLTEGVEEGRRLHRKIQKLSRENAELARSLEEREGNCRTLQEHLLKITNIDVSEVPHDRTSWKVLLAENKTYAEICTSLKKKVRELKKKQKVLMKLLWTLKEKGVPVEETYEKINRKKGVSSRKTGEELSDCDYINTEPAKTRPRPEIIPQLEIVKVDVKSFTEGQSSSSGYSDVSFSN